MKDIICYNMALGSEKGNLKVRYEPNSELNSLVEETYSSFESDQWQIVEIDTIDSFVSTNEISRIDLIKIDTEGFDFNVLLGANKTLTDQIVDFIVCEVGFLYQKSISNFDQINHYLYKKDYWLVGIYDDYYWGNKYILHGFANAMYIRKEMAFDQKYA